MAMQVDKTRDQSLVFQATGLDRLIEPSGGFGGQQVDYQPFVYQQGMIVQNGTREVELV